MKNVLVKFSVSYSSVVECYMNYIAQIIQLPQTYTMVRICV